jgi:GTPase
MTRERPVVAIVGRPNVGKSTLLNRLIGRREAIVQEKPGVTRDRKEALVEWSGREFAVVDTGGWLPGAASSLEGKVSRQSEKAMEEADLVLLVVDGVVGVTEEDERVANVLRRLDRPAMLLVNKVDSERRESDIWEFARLGLGDPCAVSALHGRGTGDLLDEIVERLPFEEAIETTERREWLDDVFVPARDEDVDAAIAIVGRPNVGKSTLFNRLIGDERSVVHDMPGTTRDTIDTVVETEAGRLRFVDTAGMRRKSRVDEGTEYYSLVRALQAIDRADASLLLIDSTEGVTHQDQRLAERIDAAGSPVVIVLNKWDVAGDAERRARVLADVEDRLAFLAYAPILKVSAQSGLGVHKLLPAIGNAIDAYRRRVPTRELNKVIAEAQAAHPAPNAKVLYATQGATDPPTFTLFATRTLPAPYLRYLERKIREHFSFGPTPLKLRVRRRSS